MPLAAAFVEYPPDRPAVSSHAPTPQVAPQSIPMVAKGVDGEDNQFEGATTSQLADTFASACADSRDRKAMIAEIGREIAERSAQLNERLK